jgi:nucleotide-binding universal stress UspA family protein
MATTILVAVDFEDASGRAVALAKDLAGPLGATLALCHVYELPLYTYPGLEPQLLPELRREVMAAAKRAITDLAQEHGIQRAILREGEPAREIIAAAHEEGASMIVVGTHGRRGLSHLLLGSVAEKVVRSSDIPVVTVRAGAGNPG